MRPRGWVRLDRWVNELVALASGQVGNPTEFQERIQARIDETDRQVEALLDAALSQPINVEAFRDPVVALIGETLGRGMSLKLRVELLERALDGRRGRPVAEAISDRAKANPVSSFGLRLATTLNLVVHPAPRRCGPSSSSQSQPRLTTAKGSRHGHAACCPSLRDWPTETSPSSPSG